MSMKISYVSAMATITCVLNNTYSNLLLHDSELPSLFPPLLKVTGYEVWRQNFRFHCHVISMLVSWAHLGSEFRNRNHYLSAHTPYMI